MNLRKTALGAALCSAPFAALAEAPVEIYGTLNADLETVKATGGPGVNYSSRNRVTQNGSNLGFRGTEDLGDGLSAFFQIESKVNFDNGQSTGFWASRNSGVGLRSGSAGMVLLGQWDSPYKYATGRLDPMGNTSIAGYTGIMGGTGGVTAGQGGVNFMERASFERRVANVIQYWTPMWGGLMARFAYGTGDTNVGNTSNGVAESTNLRPALYSGALLYEAGPLYLSAAAERHKDFQALNTLFNGTPSTGNDDAWKLAGQYSFFDRSLMLAGIVERLKYRADDLGGGRGAAERRVTNIYASLSYVTGRHVWGLGAGQKGDEKLQGTGLSDLPESKARQLSLRYGYNFSKRTQVYALATRIWNQDNAFQQFGNDPISTSTLFLDPARGADPTGFGVGMSHAF